MQSEGSRSPVLSVEQEAAINAKLPTMCNQAPSGEKEVPAVQPGSAPETQPAAQLPQARGTGVPGQDGKKKSLSPARKEAKKRAKAASRLRQKAARQGLSDASRLAQQHAIGPRGGTPSSDSESELDDVRSQLGQLRRDLRDYIRGRSQSAAVQLPATPPGVVAGPALTNSNPSAPSTPPAPLPVVSVIPVTPAPPQTQPGPMGTIMGNFKRFTVPVPRGDSARTRGLTAIGIPYHEADIASAKTARHPVGAAERFYATLRGLVELYEQGARNVLSVYGSKRDLKAAAVLNADVPIQNQLQVTVHRPMVVPKDITRRVPSGSSVQTLHPSNWDGFLLVNVYAVEGGQLNSHWLSRLAEHGPVVWLGHRFDGAFGRMSAEGAWIRVVVAGREKILARPDPKTETYPPHDPCDWLHVSGCESMGTRFFAWSPVASVGDTFLVVASMIDHELEKEAVIPVEAQYAWVDLPVPSDCSSDTLNYCVSFLPNFAARLVVGTRRTLVDRALCNQLVGTLAGRSFTTYSYRSVCAQASSILKADVNYAQIAACFPSRLESIAESTAMAAFVTHVNARAYNLQALNLSPTGSKWALYNAESARIGEAPSRKRRWLFWFAVAGLSLYFLWRSRRSSSVVAIAGPGAIDMSTVKRRARHTLTGLKQTLAAAGDVIKQSAKDTCDKYLSVLIGLRDGLVGAANFSGSLVGQAAVEEAFKKIHPVVGLVFVLVESVCKFDKCNRDFPGMLQTNRTARNDFFGALAGSIGMHLTSMLMPYHMAVVNHVLWNCFVLAITRKPVLRQQGLAHPLAVIGGLGMFSYAISRNGTSTENTRFREFRQQYYDQPWAMRGVPQSDMIAVSPFVPAEGVVRREVSPHYTKKPRDTQYMDVRGSLEPELEPVATTSVYWILPTNVPGYAPATTDDNLWSGAIVGRTLVEPPMDPIAQIAAWQHVKNWVVECDRREHSPIVWESFRDEWLDHIDDSRKKARAIEAMRTIERHWVHKDDISVMQCTIFVKSDEVLFQRLDDGSVAMKPRAIINVSPLVQCLVGPEILEASRRLHEAWDWRCSNGAAVKLPLWGSELAAEWWVLYICFGSDATDKRLSEWGAMAMLPQRRVIYIIVAGDDSLVVVHDAKGKVTVIEGDASMFDQSQALGPLLAEDRALASLGVSELSREILLSTAAAPYIARGRRFGKVVIHHPERPQRTTGGPNTSSGNSITMATACAESSCAAVSSGRDLLSSFGDHMLKLGFKMKLKGHASLETATFLKGMWFWVKHDLIWGPLPTRILKMGKSLTDPRAIYRTRDYAKACRQFLADVADSYRKFVQVPLIAEFVRTYGGIKPSGHAIEAAAPWKVAAGYEASPGAPSDLGAILDRYSLDPSELAQMCEQVESSTPFTFLEHPGYERMARVDYG